MSNPTTPAAHVIDCPVCKGVGEVATPGTYGPTISPENLEVLPCWLCNGQGTVTQQAMEEYAEHVENVTNGDGWL